MWITQLTAPLPTVLEVYNKIHTMSSELALLYIRTNKNIRNRPDKIAQLENP